MLMNVATNANMDNNDAHDMTPSENPAKSLLIDLKNGKLIFKQKTLSFEKMSETMQEIVKFREMLENGIERRAPQLSAIPEEHKPLIAKLVHESEKTLHALSKHIHRELLPAQDEDGEEASNAGITALTIDVVEASIKEIADRNDYGLDHIAGGKVPASFHVWRWEVKQKYRDWLPKAAKEKSESRIKERVQAKKDIQALFDSLPENERNIIGSVTSAKTPIKLGKSGIKNPDASITLDTSETEGKMSTPQTQKKQSRKKVQETENDARNERSTSPTAQRANAGRPKKPVDLEKAAKEKEKEDKRAAKVEKERKEQEARDKSRSLMANFFGKAKASVSARPVSHEQNASPSVAGPSSTQSEFERVFKPFIVKKDAELAPVNRFRCPQKRDTRRNYQTDGHIIVIDEDDEDVEGAQDAEMEDIQLDIDFGQMSGQDRLQDILSHLSPPAPPHRRRHPPRFKTYNRFSVREIMSRLNEAEIAGDDALVRSLLRLLGDRTLIPAKVLIFAEDARPGYFGTWTRNSRIIGPRSPFVQDIVALDYAYDSGEEWEDEGGEADDVVEDAEDEEGGEEPDSDIDSWLVDDDEEEPGTPLEDRDSSPMDLTLSPPLLKRKSAGDEALRQNTKKRKVVIPLLPFAKGPCWESTIGGGDYEPFKPYRIHLFNDTPWPIDPFTFVSLSSEGTTTVPTMDTSSDTRFAVPALPDRLIKPTVPGSSNPIPARRTIAMPKAPFPEEHLPQLLARITSVATGNVTFLIESIYQDLRAYKVKKNAIEAKVREVGEKCKEKKIWIVKPEVKALFRLS